MNIVKLKIPEYIFDKLNNPYALHLSSPKEIDGIAHKLELVISSEMPEKPVLVRGIQSGKHNLSRDALIKNISQNGTDIYNSDTGTVEIYAAPFEAGIIKNILEGFHKYKPKSEEIPQYPVDIWMIYDIDAFDNIEYVHPRHKVKAKDKWRQKNTNNNSLSKLIIIN